MKTSTITLYCAKCGNDEFEMPPNPQSNDNITCIKCGAVTPYGEAQEQAQRQAKKAVKDIASAFKKMLK